MKNILAINPGSTSTKIAVYRDETPVLVKSIPHSAEEVSKYAQVVDQLPMRKQLIFDELEKAGLLMQFDAVIGRGGLARPVEAGVYPVTPLMIEETLAAPHQHACDLGCVLAYDIAAQTGGCPALVADPGRVDQLNDYARISGSPLLPRICIWHALNQRAVARRFADDTGRRYEDMNLIICHLGGGISVAAHDHGRAVDTNNALNGEGPFSPERAGSLPAGDLIRLCFSGKHTQEELLRRIAGHAGLTAHLGTNDVREIISRIESGDKHAELILNAMIYHVAKAIGAQAPVLMGQVDAIIITGGIAHSDYVVSHLLPYIEWIAPVYIYPGEDEMLALTQNALRYLKELH